MVNTIYPCRVLSIRRYLPRQEDTENQRGLRNGLASELLWDKMVEEQYKEGFGQ